VLGKKSKTVSKCDHLFFSVTSFFPANQQSQNQKPVSKCDHLFFLWLHFFQITNNGRTTIENIPFSCFINAMDKYRAEQVAAYGAVPSCSNYFHGAHSFSCLMPQHKPQTHYHKDVLR